MNNRIDQLTSLIFATHRFLHDQMSHKNDSGFAFLHIVTLKYIREKKPLMKEIADFLGITPPSATSLVDTLAKAGMVNRLDDPNDRRSVQLEITAKGEKLIEEGMTKMKELMKKNLEVLTEDEQESLSKILAKIINSNK
jgi:DNA-binding MarR family transcriptional regulator